MRLYSHLAEAYTLRIDAQHMLAEPGGGSAGPAVAETVAEAHVAPGAAVGMDVKLALRNHLVNAGGVFPVLIVEIFPESGGAQIQHASPVGRYQVHGLGIMPAFRQRLQQVIAHERGKLLRAVFQDNVRCCLRIHKADDG